MATSASNGDAGSCLVIIAFCGEISLHFEPCVACVGLADAPCDFLYAVLHAARSSYGSAAPLQCPNHKALTSSLDFGHGPDWKNVKPWGLGRGTYMCYIPIAAVRVTIVAWR